MGNCTAAIRKKSGLVPAGNCQIVDINLSTSYATGGDTLPASLLGFKNLDAVSLSSSVTSPAGHPVEIIYGAFGVDPKLRVRDVATGAEISAATNLSAQSLKAVVYGDLIHP